MKYIFFILLVPLIVLTRINGQNKVVGNYHDYFGSSIQLNADHSFLHEFRFDMVHKWTVGTWSERNDTLILTSRTIFDTVAVHSILTNSKVDSLILALDSAGKRLSDDEFKYNQNTYMSAQEPWMLPIRFVWKNDKLYTLLSNGKLVTKKVKGIWGRKRYPPYLMKEKVEKTNLLYDINHILKLYYKSVFSDSSQNSSSAYYLLPKTIQIEADIESNSNGIRTIPYNPEKFYKTLKLKFKVLSKSEISPIENYLGASFIIENPTNQVVDLKIFPTDSTATRYKELKKNIDLNYQVEFNKEHSVIFNIKPKWVYESDFTTSRIIFRNNFNEAIVKINRSNWTSFAWAYFVKDGKKWRLDRVENIGMLR